MKEDKVLKKILEENLEEYQNSFTTLDGSIPSSLSPLGIMTDPKTLRLLMYLVGTLNYLFTDYDFRYATLLSM